VLFTFSWALDFVLSYFSFSPLSYYFSSIRELRGEKNFHGEKMLRKRGRARRKIPNEKEMLERKGRRLI
jgi:hypothetical protein